MALIEKTIIDKIEVVGPFKHVQVREDRQIVDEDTGVAKASGNWRRYVLSPGDDLGGQPADVAAIANAAWTDEIVAAYEARQAEPPDLA
jgi:hypothetical protein